MPYLKNKRCYLSGPIENDDTQTHNWRNEPKKALVEKFGIDLFDPFDDPKQQWVPVLAKARRDCDYPKMSEIASNFVRKDLCMVDRADFIVAYVPYKVCTTGTTHEIIFSHNAKKPTMLVCPQGKEFVPLWYYGFMSHEYMFGSWEDLYSYLQDVDDGQHKKDNRWHYVYGMI